VIYFEESYHETFFCQNILLLTQKCKHLCSLCIALRIVEFFPITFLLDKINASDDLLEMVSRVMRSIN